MATALESSLPAPADATAAAALGSSLPAPADATAAATTTTTTTAAAAATAVAAATTTVAVATTIAEVAAAATAVATVVAAPVEDDLEDPLDAVLALALEGINLVFSMDNPLGFTAMSHVSREPEIQGEPPQVSVLSSPLS